MLLSSYSQGILVHTNFVYLYLFVSLYMWVNWSDYERVITIGQDLSFRQCALGLGIKWKVAAIWLIGNHAYLAQF